MTQQKKQLGVLIATVVLMLGLAIGAQGYFTRANLTDLFLAMMPVMIIAIGMTLIILTGKIDISVGSIFAVSSVAMGACAEAGLPILLSAFVACLIGAACGLINGAFTAYLQIPSIVVTLATMVTLRDALRWKTQGTWISNLPVGFQWFGQTATTYLVACILFVAVLILFALYGLRHLHAGRIVYATGSNEQAARMMGIDTRRVVLTVFAITGLLTGVAAAANATRFNQIPSNLGLGLEMQVIAAVAVGGAEINGGSASIVGTVLGVILLGCISSALTFLHVSPYWEKAIQGLIILFAIAADAFQTHRTHHADARAN